MKNFIIKFVIYYYMQNLCYVLFKIIVGKKIQNAAFGNCAQRGRIRDNRLTISVVIIVESTLLWNVM